MLVSHNDRSRGMKTKHSWWTGQVRGTEYRKKWDISESNFSRGKGPGKTRLQLVRVNDCLSSGLVAETRSLDEGWLEQEAAGGRLGGQQRKRGNGEAWREGISKRAKREGFYFPTATCFILYILGKMSLRKWFHSPSWAWMLILSPQVPPIPCVSIEGRGHQLRKKI